MKITQEELNEIIEKHRKWLNGEGGERANLRNCDMYGCDMHGCDMRGCYMRNCDMRDCDMHGCDMYGCDMYGCDMRNCYMRNCDMRNCDMRGCNMRNCDMRNCDMRGCNMRNCDMRGCDMRNCDMRGCYMRNCNMRNCDMRNCDMRGCYMRDCNICDATINLPICCPDTGSFTAWKKVREGYIVQLEVLKDAKRLSSTGRKCRCDKAKVLSIQNVDGTPANVQEAVSEYDNKFLYRVGEVVSVDTFDENRWNECSNGIHFFVTRQEAVDYGL